MDQVGQHRSSLTKRRFRERFVRPGQNAVLVNAGVQDYAHVAFRHMATRTIVRRLLLLSYVRGSCSSIRVTGSALLPRSMRELPRGKAAREDRGKLCS